MRKRTFALTLLLAAPLLTACDFVLIVAALLIIGPAYPGIPQPPAVPPGCPLPTHEASALPEIPTDLVVDDVTTDCNVPQKPALHRLNRDEMTRTLNDLLGVVVDPALFPPDDQGAGFDTDAGAHHVSPLLVERLEAVARDTVASALRRRGDVPEKTVVEAETLRGAGTVDETVRVIEGGSVDTLISAPVPGRYAIRVRAAGHGLAGEKAKMGIVVDGKRVFSDEVSKDFELKSVTVRFSRNDQGGFQPTHTLAIEHENGNEIDGKRRQLLLDLVEIEGPFDADERGPPTLARSLILPCEGDAESLDEGCAKKALSLFAARAWRTAIDVDDANRLAAFYDDQRAAGDSIEDAFGTAVTAALVSPRFLNRVELDGDAADGDVRMLTSYELASRLSYFLWSSMPDNRLFELAESDALLDERVLLGEARRMLDDPRASAVVERFFAQYLGLGALDSAHPDPERFPEFDEDLRTSMRCETELLVDRLLREKKVATELLTSTTTQVNHKLAAHYGLPPPQVAVGGSPYVEVDVSALQRSGVLTQGSVMTMTSQPTRTSPTKRGKWALDRLLCTTPDPPPPGVEGLAESAEGDEPASVRELLEAHRSDPVCASCHSVIDPLGLPLEHFDAIGRFRGSDARFAIDDSALYNGTEGDVVKGAHGLGERIAEDDLFTYCLADRALTYGTGVKPDDDCLTSGIWERFIAPAPEGSGGVLSELLVDVIRSPGFRLRAATKDAGLFFDRNDTALVGSPR